MGFRLVPKSVTVNDLERRNGVVCIISPNSVALGPYYAKVFEDTTIYILRVKCSPKNLVLAVYHLWRYSNGITPSAGVKV